MANVKITQLPSATTPLTGTEVFPLVQGTTTKQVAITGLFTSPVMTNPTLGTVGQADLINATGLPISTGVAGLGTGIATFLGTPSSANLRAAVTDETGTGSLVFATSPTLVTPNLGTPSVLVATNATGTALGLIAGSAVTNANLTGAVTSVGNATSLGSFTSAQLITALTDETGSGSAVFSTSPTLVTPALGTPSALVGTNITGTATNFNINGTVGATTPSTVTGTTITANTRFVGTNFDASGSGGGALRTSSSANVLQWGGGGGVNLTLDGAFNMNPANASISIAPTGTGTLTINPATAGTINNMAIGGTTPAAGAFTTLSASTAIATTSGGTGLTSFTSGGVVYASSTSALATGSVLQFDGTNLLVGTATATYNQANRTSFEVNGTATSIMALKVGNTPQSYWYYDGANVDFYATNGNLRFGAANTLGLTLTSTSLYTASGINVGIGTSSPAYKLDVLRSGSGISARFGNGTTYAYIYNDSGDVYYGGDANAVNAYQINTAGNFARISTNNAERMRIDSAGNLGLGVTPSAWYTTLKAFDVGASGSSIYSGGITHNAYFDNTDVRWEYKNASSTPATFLNIQSGEFVFNVAGSGTAGNAITFTQAMTLDASGRLVIGDTTATQKLTVVNNNGTYGTIYQPIVQIGNTSSGGTTSANTGLGAIVWSTDGTATPVASIEAIRENPGSGAASALAFRTGSSGGGTERARIDSSGNLLVGTTSAYGVGLTLKPAGEFSSTLSGTSGTHCFFLNNNGIVGSIASSATVTFYNTTSDQRLKENIQDADSASSLIDSLQVRKFDWKADGSHQRYGFVAQELATVAPEAVHQPTDTEQMMAVDYSKLVPMLVKEIQSLRQRVAQLETN